MSARCAPRAWLAAATLLFASAPAPSRAQGTATSTRALTDKLTAPRDWLAGTFQEQLDRDPTLVPFGKGALFVPSMTNPFDEPPVSVWSGDQFVAEGTTGQRILLVPGTYSARIGSGSSDSERMELQVTVRERLTTIVPVSWAGLQVHVVDDQATSLRASYEIIRVEDRQYVGIGFGTDELAGEPVSTWILRPGLYKIVRVGDNYRARRDFSTVRVEPGRLTHFMLVIDPIDGDFVGGGEVPETELFLPRDGFFGSLVLGGDLSLASRTNGVGVVDGITFNVRGFADGKLSFEIFGAPLILQLQLEEQQTKSPNLPFQNANDRLKLDALYLYPLEPWVGPYARAGAETNLFNVTGNFESPVTVRRTSLDGTEASDVTDQVRLRPSFGLTRVKEGAGLHLRVFKTLFGEASVRTGVGARHRLTRDLFVPESTDEGAAGDPRPGAIDFVEVDSTHQIGFETTAIAVVRIDRYAIINVDIDALVPFDEPSALIVEAEGSITVRLTSYVGVNYVVRLRQDPTLSPDPAIEQDIRLRFSLELL